MKKQAPAKPSMAPAVMTVREVAAYLRVHPSTIYRLLKQGKIPGFRVDSDWRFHVKTIDEWRSRMEAHPRPEVLARGSPRSRQITSQIAILELAHKTIVGPLAGERRGPRE